MGFLSFLRRKKCVDETETLRLLRLMKGQQLIGVTHDSGEWLLHFEDWVVFVEQPFPSPIIRRINGRNENR